MAEIRVNATGELKLYDSDDSNYVSFKSGGTVSSDVTWTLPTADGSNGQALTTNGSGTLSWATASSADPSSADGDSLGTASAEWSDLYLADGGIIYLGNDQDIRLTHNADKGLIIKHSATADDKPVILTLQTGETDMAADDVIGKIEFQAPDEGTGTDAVLVSGAIQAVAEGDHSSSSNATRLEFMTGASEAATSQMTVSSGGIVGVGAGVPGDLGVGLHVRTGDSGGDVHNDADELVIEQAGAHVGMTFLNSGDNKQTINFGDDSDNNVGQIEYDHSGNTMKLVANTAEVLRMDSSGKVATGAESTPDVDGGGITIDLNANDGKFLTLKSSDFSHGITDHLETDTGFAISKSQAGGGVSMTACNDGANENVWNLTSIMGETNTTATNTTAGGNFTFGVYCKASSGTGTQAVADAGNAWVMRNNNAARLIFKGDGEIHSDTGSTTYDAYDDAQLVRAFDLSHGKGVIESKFDKFIAYNHEKLADLGLVGREEDGTPNHFTNITGMQKLHNGAIWQQYEKHNQLLEAVYDLAKEAVGEEKANAILDKHEVKRLQ